MLIVVKNSYQPLPVKSIISTKIAMSKEEINSSQNLSNELALIFGVIGIIIALSNIIIAIYQGAHYHRRPPENHRMQYVRRG